MNYYTRLILICFILLFSFRDATSQTLSPISFIKCNYNNENKTAFSQKIHLYPSAGFTFNSGFLPGFFISNQKDSIKKFGFQIMPLYAWKQQNAIGEIKLSFNVLPKAGKITHIQTFISGRSYFFPSSNDFEFRASRLEIGVRLSLRNPTQKTELNNQITAKIHFSSQDGLGYTEVDSNWVPQKNNRYIKALRLKWNYDFNREINALVHELSVDISDDFARVQGIYCGKINYDSPKKFFEYRFYAGGYLFKESSFQQNFDGRVGISGLTSEQDIFIDHWFLGRNYAAHHISDQQTYIDQGGFYTNMIAGKSWDWVTSMTFKTTLPFDAPFQLYLGLGAYPNIINNKVQTAYEGGILFAPIPGVFEIAFPILVDPKSLETLNLNTDNYLEKIRFILNFEKLKGHPWLNHRKIPNPFL